MLNRFRSITPNHDIIRGRVIYLLLLVTFVQSVYPITSSGAGLLAYQFLYASLIVAGVLVVRNHPIFTVLLVIFGLGYLVAGTIYTFNQTALWALFLANGVIVVYQAMLIFVLADYIFSTNHINTDVIFAASAVYLLLGALFVPIYGLIDTITFAQTGTNAFTDGAFAGDTFFPWQTLIYYSYATLTTLGYGDVLPVTMVARSAASLQAIIGVLYITVIMARLVGLYATRKE